MNKREHYLAFGTPDFTEAEIDAVTRIMRSGWVGMGQETISFEKELSEYIGAPEVVTVNSCTSALFLALLVEGIGPGDVLEFSWVHGIALKTSRRFTPACSGNSRLRLSSGLR